MERARRGYHWKQLCLALFLLVASVPGCVDASLGMAGGPGGIGPGFAPDPSYTPSVGDRATLVGNDADAPPESVPLLRDVTAFDKYERARRSQSTSELADMEQEALLQRTPTGTRVSVLSLKDRTHVGERHAVEVRILDGPLKDKTGWTPSTLVTRLIATEPAQ